MEYKYPFTNKSMHRNNINFREIFMFYNIFNDRCNMIYTLSTFCKIPPPFNKPLIPILLHTTHQTPVILPLLELRYIKSNNNIRSKIILLI